MQPDTSKKESGTNQAKDSAGNYATEREPGNKDMRSKEEGLGGTQKAAEKPAEKPAEKQTVKPNQGMDSPQRGKEADKGEVRKDQPRN